MSFSLTLSHFGMFVTDINRMVEFYTRFLGFAVSDRGQNANGEIVFMTRDPREHHQIVMAAGRPAGPWLRGRPAGSDGRGRRSRTMLLGRRGRRPRRAQA